MSGTRKGFSYYLEDDKIIEYLKLPPRVRLEWLEEIFEFNRKALKGKRKKIWQALRMGEV
ncbi:hypothetical protein ACFL2G_01075 [Candidatus Omnitrophota bacterium]